MQSGFEQSGCAKLLLQPQTAHTGSRRPSRHTMRLCGAFCLFCTRFASTLVVLPNLIVRLPEGPARARTPVLPRQVPQSRFHSCDAYFGLAQQNLQDQGPCLVLVSFPGASLMWQVHASSHCFLQCCPAQCSFAYLQSIFVKVCWGYCICFISSWMRTTCLQNSSLGAGNFSDALPVLCGQSAPYRLVMLLPTL